MHTVDGTAMLVTPGIFKRYVQEHPELEKQAQAKETTGWKLVQRASRNKGLHRRPVKPEHLDHQGFWSSQDERAQGYLLQDPQIAVP
ncbi:conjugal transfer nickase/helicase domain-containing protein [Pseudomonas aeruginosa]|uniref:conjugal transfer nickase/helicase domain-containing protein n=1 Tax=Pseudomonas aeruginosa TaxID=287 RepID=UPI003EE0B543